MNSTSVSSSLAAKASNDSTISSKRCSEKSTRSILFTQTVRCGTPTSEETKAWRLVCSTTPLRASTRISARSAVEAPVTMLRV